MKYFFLLFRRSGFQIGALFGIVILGSGSELAGQVAKLRLSVVPVGSATLPGGESLDLEVFVTNISDGTIRIEGGQFDVPCRIEARPGGQGVLTIQSGCDDCDEDGINFSSTGLPYLFGLTGIHAFAPGSCITAVTPGPGEPSFNLGPGITRYLGTIRALAEPCSSGTFDLDFECADQSSTGGRCDSVPEVTNTTRLREDEPPGPALGPVIGIEFVGVSLNVQTPSGFTLGGRVFETCLDPIGSGVGGVRIEVTCPGFSDETESRPIDGSWSMEGVPCGPCMVCASAPCRRLVSASDPCDSDGLNCTSIQVDSEHESLNRRIAFRAMVPALTESMPGCNECLWRAQRNVVRLQFDADLLLPEPGAIEVRELFSGGGLGPDLGSAFTLQLEVDQQGDTNVLRLDEIGTVLAHRHWYAFLNSGAWECVAPFRVDFQVQVGDASNDCRVLAADVSRINAGIPCTACSDDRRDINGDQRILALDASLANAQVPSPPVPKPSGHVCNPR